MDRIVMNRDVITHKEPDTISVLGSLVCTVCDRFVADMLVDIRNGQVFDGDIGNLSRGVDSDSAVL